MADTPEASRSGPQRPPARRPRPAGRAPLPAESRFWARRNLLRLLLVVAVLALIAGISLFREDIVALASEEAMRRLGYVPVFVIPLLSSSSVFLPLPGAAAIFLGGAILSPLLVGLVAGAGETLGELTGYAAGYGVGAVVDLREASRRAQECRVDLREASRRAQECRVERRPRYQAIASWTRRYGSAVLFLLAVVPNPLFDVAGMTAGALRYPLWRFVPVVLAGKIIKDTGLALAGAWGARGLADWVAPLWNRP